MKHFEKGELFRSFLLLLLLSFTFVVPKQTCDQVFYNRKMFGTLLVPLFQMLCVYLRYLR